MQAEAAVISAEQEAKASHIENTHQEIWALLSNQSQNQLITMRGDNTDNEFQGWIDLSLAAKNQDVASSIANWLTYYPDHNARALAKNLALQSNASASKISPVTQGGIALILPITDEANITQAEAFQQGLQAALTKHGLNNEIKTYISANSLEAIIEQHAQARSEGATYFIALQLSDDDTPADMASYLDSHHMLSIGLPLKDEATQMAKFATSHAMQHLLIINTDSEAAQAMTSSFRAAWQAELGTSDQNDQISAITLPDGVTAEELNLFDLKAQVAVTSHDMVVLAMSATDVRTIRPHLNISTPTLAFSDVNDTSSSGTTLNALRFVDIPFLLPTNNGAFTAYKDASANLNSNELLRWFALGVDALQLLAASTQANNSEVIVNGLTGELTLDQAGHINRQLSMARFTFNGIELEP
jgi:outer membrane PBP1 activator LpoA protein